MTMILCIHCQTPFEVTAKDRQFYEKMDVPRPTFCPPCRMQRRLSYRSERFLYHRKCDLTGKQIISTYSTDKPFPVYNVDDWWGDQWNPLDYGRDFDFNRPFFEQFFELRNQVPRLALIQQKPMENSEYCNAAGRNKNCYLCFSANSNEDCYYCSWLNYSKNCVDCKTINNSELCYECIDVRDCYNLKYSQNCFGCKDSYFLRNCQSCSNCFGCSNLVNKKYYIFNKPHTKEAYENFIQNLNLGDHCVIEKIKANINQELSDLIVKEFEGANNENSVGNYLRNNKNAHVCFDCEDSEDISYCQALFKAKNAMDHSYWGDGTENTYECQACGNSGFNLRFCNLCWSGCANLTYCDHCFASNDCFGSVGLRRNKYVILNKQYLKNEYGVLMSKIIEHMKKTGEWGEFFPASHSHYAYSEVLANEDVPVDKEKILENGWQWKEEKRDMKNYKGPEYAIPNDIKEVSDEITKQILLSEQSGKPYKIIPQELKFYQENNIPIPRLTPDERHWERLKKRNPRILYNRQCAKCQKAIQTTYAPNRPEKVYCEECYLKEVY